MYKFANVTGLHCNEILVDLMSKAYQTHLQDTYFKTNAIKTFDLLNKIQKWLRGKPQEYIVECYIGLLLGVHTAELGP